MNKMGRWEQPYELLYKSYSDGCAYYGKLKKEGQLIDMTMSEFADYYREKKGVNDNNYNEPECALWRDILYGSDKQLFWYCDPYMRACVNMDQGGAIVDLRPYAAKLEWPVGIGTKHVQDASYPFLIQEKYRAGYFTHYAGEGTVRSAKLSYKGEEVDLCLCPTHAHFSQEGKTRILTLDPVTIEFRDLTVKLQTKEYFEEGSSNIKIERNILEMSDPTAEVTLNEYMVACYGTTEYSEDMSNITLKIDGPEEKEIHYAYKCREEGVVGAKEVSAVIPEIETRVSMTASDETAEGYVKETPDRKCVWTIQTPQIFSYALIREAHDSIRKKDMSKITDAAMVIEQETGVKVALAEGSYQNIKITTPEDLYIAEAFLR